MRSYETIRYDVRNNIAWIILNRPDAANGINRMLLSELGHAAECCDADPAIKAVILTGAGRFFSAGGDLKEMDSYGDEAKMIMKARADCLHKSISTFARMDAPLITVVNGMAAGAGFSLSITGDIVIAAESAVFTLGYTKVGLSPDGSASYYLPRLIGVRKTQELMFLNRKLSAQEAHEWGLIQKVVPDEKLMQEAEKTARLLAKNAVQSNAVIKKLLLCSFSSNLETQMELEGRYIADCAGSHNGKEGVRAFIEKRTAKFR